MKISGKSVRESIFRTRTPLCGSDRARKYPGDEPPLRAELFSANQMEQHGRILADMHKLMFGRHRDHLLARFFMPIGRGI